MVDETQIDVEQEVLRLQMDDTRESLTDKIGRLNEKVTETVESATASVAEATATVMESVHSATSSVSDTVGSVAEAVRGTVDSVRHSVKGTVDSVKGAFDLKSQVEQHPWLMVTGAVAVGYGVQEFFRRPSEGASAARRKDRSSFVPNPTFRTSHDWDGQSLTALPEQRHNGTVANGSVQTTSAMKPPQPAGKGWMSLLSEKLAPELGNLEELVLGTVLGSLRDMLTPHVPQSVQKPLAEILDNVTKKLGGKCIKGSKVMDPPGQTEPSMNRELPFRMPR